MSALSFHHLIEAEQIDKSDVEKLITLAEKFRLESVPKNCRDKIAATLFFEPSTRTRMSFESAMLRLGGQVITLENGETSSVKKGESLSDTGRIVSSYADILIARHPENGSIAELAKYATVPVINAGDGTNQHPTQSLVDLYMIFCEKKRLDNLKIGVLGDLKYGRTVHSLLTLMNRYENNHFTLISHPSLALANKPTGNFIETDDLQSAIRDLDILYVTRVQQERFENKAEYAKMRDYYRIDKKLLTYAKQDLTLMHPLPRINEIDEEVDFTPQARYFAQANYAVYIRMALLSLMLSK